MKEIIKMEIVIKNKIEDMAAYTDYFLAETEEGKKFGKFMFSNVQAWTIVYPALLGVFFWGTNIRNWGFPLFMTIGLFGLIQFGILLTTGFKPSFYYGKKAYKNQEKTLTPKDLEIFQLEKTLAINDDWLEVRSSAVLHKWKWVVVDSVAITANFIFIRIGKNFTIHIPKRDFQSEQSFVEFGKKLVELKEKIKDQPIGTE